MNPSPPTERIDPAALRVALRTAIFMPLSFALATAFLSADARAMAAFGSFIILAMVTFGGRPGPRLIAWLSLVLGGCALITIGTLLSTAPTAAGVAAAGIVSFLIFYLGVVNPYIAAARSGAVLLLALPLMVEVPASAIDDRLAGWLLASALCIPATYLLWRLPWVGELRRQEARACGALADLVRDPGSEELRDRAYGRVSTLRRRYLATPHRPTGATGVSAAIATLVEELGWLYALITVPGASIEADGRHAHRLRIATAELLDCSARALAGSDVRLPVEPVESALRELVDGSARELVEIAEGDAEAASRQLEHEFRLRKVAYAALDSARLVAIATEREKAPGVLGKVWTWVALRSRGQVEAAGRLITEHANPRSAWFQNSVRGATGIALAVLAADLLSVQNSFWVVLGTLSILRNNALGTRESVWRALGGTLVGIVIGTILIDLIGGDRVLLWIALPLSVLFASYAPRAISFAAGQAGFALLVMVLYNLIEPVGWQVAIIRIQDVAVGCGVCLMVGLFIWPRGATALIRRSLADSLEAGAKLVRERAYGVLDGRAGVENRTWEEAVAASDRLDSVLRQFLDESTGEKIDQEALLTLASSGLRLRRTAKGMGRIPVQPWYVAPGRDASPRLEHLIDEVTGWYETVGGGIERDEVPPEPVEVDPDIPRALVTQIDAGREGEGLGAGIARVWLYENLAYLSELSARYERHARDLFRSEREAEAQSG